MSACKAFELSRAASSKSVWKAAASSAGGSLSNLIRRRNQRLLDLIVVGQEAAGKSSILSALAGVKLPLGPDGTTRIPVTTTISENLASEAVRLHWPIGGTRALGPEGLDVGTYTQAIQLLSSQDETAAVVGAVKGLKIEIGCRPYVAVITHAEVLKEEHHLIRKVQLAKQELEKKNCKGLFLVSLTETGGDHDANWYRNLFLDESIASVRLTEKERSGLVNLCGLSALRAALHKLQYEHMLTDYSEVMGKLRAKLQEVGPSVQKLQQSEVDLQNEFCQALLLVQKDVEESHRGRDQLGDFSEVDQKQRLHYEISQILNAFAARSFNTALTNINRRWATETSNMVVNNTLMIDWRTKIWNISSRGMHEVLGSNVAEAALTDLKKALLGFVQWRARHRLSFMAGNAHSHTIFMDFLERYTSDKLSVLQKECEMIREEVHINELDTHAPFAFWLFVQQAMQSEEDSETMVVNILQSALGVQNAEIGKRQGAFWPMDLPWFHDLFSKDLHHHQLMSIVLLFFTVGEIVERLSKRMVCIMFGR
ncbi:hypothetical protein WJX73_004134 [Symbiochloris irregularis]|uniref:Uncharacterized protein n=1 Tax=Symbiochloris irregularis TaxID=706552 RepID=A0AAW1NVJ7_9CHLO